MAETQKKSSKGARRFSARMAAVQAVYQAMMTKRPVRDIIREHDSAPGAEEDDIAFVEPDLALFSAVAQGVYDRFEDIDSVVRHTYANKEKSMEALLQAILYCAVWELLANTEVDTAVIINDYLDITHGFYEKSEVSLVNGMLDSISKNIRD